MLFFVVLICFGFPWLPMIWFICFFFSLTSDDEMCNFYVMYWTHGSEGLNLKQCFSYGPPLFRWSWRVNNIPEHDASTLWNSWFFKKIFSLQLICNRNGVEFFILTIYFSLYPLQLHGFPSFFFLLETIHLCFVILFLFVSTYFDSIDELIFWIGLLVWLVLMKCATFTSCIGLTHTRASWIRNTASPKVLLITTGLLRDVWQTFQLMRKPPNSGQFWK